MRTPTAPAITAFRPTSTSLCPTDATLDIASKRGDVSINGRKADVKLSVQRGDVALTEIGGSAKSRSTRARFGHNNITGTVDIDGRVDDATLEDCARLGEAERRLLQQHPAEQDSPNRGVQVGALRYHDGLSAGRPGDFRRFAAGDRRGRADAPGDALQGNSSGRCQR